MTAPNNNPQPPDWAADTLLLIGFLLGGLLRPEASRWLVALCAQESTNGPSVWRYVRRLRDRLTDVLVEAGREQPTEYLGEIDQVHLEEK